VAALVGLLPWTVDRHAQGRRRGADQLAKSIMKGFATGSNDSYVEALELPARPGVTYQLSFATELHRGAGKGGAYLNMLAMDIEIS
jgi:hypothetical protein